MQMSLFDERPIHCESGSSFMGLTVNAGISTWNKEMFCLSSSEMLSRALTASRIKDDPDSQ